MSDFLTIDFILSHHAHFSLMAGFFLDCILGDPHFFPHPVRFMGALIAFLEKKLNKSSDSARKQRFKGFILVSALVFSSFLIPIAILYACSLLSPILFLVVESIFCYQCIAARSLCHESMRVYRALKICDLFAARKAVSMIVGRDTDILDEKAVARAAVETVAESANDGVVAPLFFMAIFGAPGAFVYKAINTMDSMIAYKSERYINFGFCAAKLDDIANFLPARLAAVFMIFASFIFSMIPVKPGFSCRNALKIFIRDRYKHASPNSAQTESVMAGALGLRLAGDTVYGGKLEKKEFIGDKRREIENQDIFRANLLMYGTTLLFITFINAIYLFAKVIADCPSIFLLS